MIDHILKTASIYNHKLKHDLVIKAYNFAEAAHINEYRASNIPFIEHPVMVAKHLADIKVDSYTLAAALLHDVLENTGIGKHILVEEFGETVAELVDGVTTIKRIKTNLDRQYYTDNIRKLLLATSRDIRVVLIRLAEELHNLETLEGLEPELQKLTLNKTFEIYAPLAERIGVHHFKSRLEDIAFQRVNPGIYTLIENYNNETREDRERNVNKTTQRINELLQPYGIKGKVFGRVKHNYSIYKKYLRKRKERESVIDFLGGLNDKLAIMILVDKIEDCYTVLDLIHREWVYDPKEFDDYITNPKPNGYSSIQTAIFALQGQRIEIQIKTHAMHEYNEFGPASHVFYKEIGADKSLKMKAPEERIKWLKDLVEWQEDILEEKEFEESLKIEAFGDRVFVLTPKGDVQDLPKGSTPIDFAYGVHTELGNQTIGAKVNNKLVSLHYKLRNGDVCEILASKQPKLPSPDWIHIVKTRLALHRIKKSLVDINIGVL